MSEKSHPDAALLDQAALYAIDALPADEAARFRSLARETPSLAELVAEYEAAGSLLAESLPPAAPSPELRARILAGVTAKPVVPVETPPAGQRHSAALFVPWGVAAALTLAASWMWLDNQQLTLDKAALRNRVGQLGNVQKELEALRATSATKDQETAALQARITDLEHRNALAETQVATLTSKLDASYLASIAWDNSAQEGILKVRRLPAAQRGKDYQLWVIDPNSAAPVSGGVFTVQADGSATIRFSPAQKVSAATAFAVSMEPAGGSAAPQGPIVLSN